VKRFFTELAAVFGGIGTLAFFAGWFIGWCYWMWIAIQIGSFWMFVFGLAGPCALIAALLGLWSLIFGAPLWLVHIVQ
jgi:hypothetical protein